MQSLTNHFKAIADRDKLNQHEELPENIAAGGKLKLCLE